MSRIERELTMVIQSDDKLKDKIEPKKGEDRQKFLYRLVGAGYDLSEKKWDKLSDEVKVWFNEAAKAFEKEQPIPEPDDTDEKKVNGEDKPARKGKEKDEEKDEEKPKEKSRRRAREDDKQEEKDEDKPKEREGRRRRSSEDDQPEEKEEKDAKRASKEKDEDKPSKRDRDEDTGDAPKSVRQMVRYLVCKNPNISTDELETRIKKAHPKATRFSLATTRSSMRDAMRMMLKVYPEIRKVTKLDMS